MSRNKGNIPLSDLSSRYSFGEAVAVNESNRAYNLRMYGHEYNPGEGPADVFLERETFEEKRALIAKAARKRKQAEKAARRMREGKPVGAGCVPRAIPRVEAPDPKDIPPKWLHVGRPKPHGPAGRGHVSSIINGASVNKRW